MVLFHTCAVCCWGQDCVCSYTELGNILFPFDLLHDFLYGFSSWHGPFILVPLTRNLNFSHSLSLSRCYIALHCWGCLVGWSEGESEKNNNRDYPHTILIWASFSGSSDQRERSSHEWSLPWSRNGSQKREKSGKERKIRVLLMLTSSKVCLFLVLCLESGISLGNFVHTGVPWLSLSLGQNQEIKVKNKPKKLTRVLVTIQILISLPNLLAII